MRTMKAMRLTAALCTRDRPEELRRALASLAIQDTPPDEILVVENAPRDGRVREMIERGFPGVRWVPEPVPGLDFARNRALAAATGDVVAFLDDDAVAGAGWAGALREPFADPQIGAVTGRVEALATDTPGQQLVEANGGYSRGLRRIRLPEEAEGPLHGLRAPLIAWAVSVGSGCSLAVRRSLLLEIGGFDEALDLGAELPGGGDHDALWRVLEAGSSVLYEPAAFARHEHRRDLAAAGRQIVGHQRALVAFLVKSLRRSRGRRRFGVLSFLLWRLVKPFVRLVRRAAGRDPLPAPLLLRLLAGCWSGLWAYPAARRTAARRRSLSWSVSPTPS
jgi:glycosyltransferase involved in cell wall biosynthesis